MQNDLQELISVFTEIDSEEKMQKLFEELFTMKEKYDLALRWRLTKDLYTGHSQREIAQTLGISLCKITRGSKILKDDESVIKQKIKEKIDGSD